MKYSEKRGELYFLTETDFLTLEPSRNIKIGLVKEGRGTLERVREHQTGNSRSVSLKHSISSNSINLLETFLHKRLATSRLHGEWFVLSEKDEELALHLADNIETTLREIADLAPQVQTVSTLESDGKLLRPSKSDLALHDDMLKLRAQKKSMEINQAELRVRLGAEIQSHAGLSGVARWQVSSSESKFSQAQLKKVNPSLATELLETADKAQGAFRILGERRSPAAGRVTVPTNIDELITECEYKDRTREHEEVHHDFLVSVVEISKLELELLLMQHQFCSRIGISSGIEGLVEWDRKRKQTLPGDTQAIVLDRDEKTWKECFTRASKSVSLDVFDFRPYQSEEYKFEILTEERE